MKQEGVKRELRNAVEKTNKVRQLSLYAFPVPDPGLRRHVHAPMCIR